MLAAVAGVANSFFRPAVLAGVPNLVCPRTSLRAPPRCSRPPSGWRRRSARCSAARSPARRARTSSTGSTRPRSCSRRSCSSGSRRGFLQSEQGDQAAATGATSRDGLGSVPALAPAPDRARRLRPDACSATGLVNVAEMFLATRSLGVGVFGYGLLWTATRHRTRGRAASSTGALVGRRQRPAMLYPLGFAAAGPPARRRRCRAERVGGCARDDAGRLRQRPDLPDDSARHPAHTLDRMRGRAFTLVISAHNALLGLAMVVAGELTNLTVRAGRSWSRAPLTASGGLTALRPRRETCGRRPQCRASWLRSIPA